VSKPVSQDEILTAQQKSRNGGDSATAGLSGGRNRMRTTSLGHFSSLNDKVLSVLS
jgi:hypothetical protein